MLDRLPAALLGEKEVVEPSELFIQRWLLVAVGEVEPDLGAVEEPLARPDRIISQPDSRSAHRPKELVLSAPPPSE